MQAVITRFRGKKIKKKSVLGRLLVVLHLSRTVKEGILKKKIGDGNNFILRSSKTGLWPS